MDKRRYGRAAFLLKALGENLLPCFFQLWGAAHIPWLMAAFHLEKKQLQLFNAASLVTSFLTLAVLPSFIYKDL